MYANSFVVKDKNMQEVEKGFSQLRMVECKK
jgi:hypothetical protein